MTSASLAPLCHQDAVVILENAHSTSLLQPVYVMMHKIITKMLVPKIGHREKVTNFAIDLLVQMHTHGNERFDLVDFLYQQIRLASYLQDRSFHMHRISKFSLMKGFLLKSKRKPNTKYGLLKLVAPLPSLEPLRKRLLLEVLLMCLPSLKNSWQRLNA
jgi:hypothetical protein